MPEERAPIQRIVRGAVQTLSSSYFARLVNWGANILLMRKLLQEDFGYVTLAISLLTIITALRRFGLHTALLHQYDRVDQLAPTHFLLNTGLGILSTSAAIGLAFLFVCRQYGEIVVTVLIIFAVLDLVRNAASTSETQLRHDLRFGRLAVSQATATIVASFVAIAIAYAGGGVWALILGFFVNSVSYIVVYCTLIWTHQPVSITRLWNFNSTSARGLFRYGFWYWIGGIMQTLTLQVDKLVVGTLLSAGVLGFYAQAHMFAQIPTGAITHTLLLVTGTVYARYQNDRMRLSAAFRRTMRLIFRTTVLITLLLAVEAPALVKLLAEERWLPLVPILRWLVVYSLCRPLLDDVYTLFLGMGKPNIFAQITAIQAGLLLFLAPILTGRFGPEGAAMSMGLMALVGIVLAFRAASRHVDIPWYRAFVPPLLAAGAAFAVRLAFADFVGSLPTLLSLIAGAILICSTYGLGLLVLEGRELREEFQRLWDAFTGRTNSPENRQ